MKLRLRLFITYLILYLSHPLLQSKVLRVVPRIAQAQSPDSSPSHPPTELTQQILTLAQVLETLPQAHPKLISAAQAQRQARGELRSASGVWDPKLSLKGSLNPLSAYQRGGLQSELRQGIPWAGADLFVGYRVTAGEIPVYREEDRTLPSGEVRAGVDLPLLAGRSMDQRRTELQITTAGVGVARAQIYLQRIELERDAAIAYWSWVAAHHLLKIQHELLTMAQTRDRALRAQVSHGSKPPIMIVDNQRLILERSSAEVSAQLALRNAAYKLSFYDRDPKSRQPQVPLNLRPPPLSKLPNLNVFIAQQSAASAQILEDHPLLQTARQDLIALRARVEWARSEYAPQLALGAYVSQDLGEPQQQDTAQNKPWATNPSKLSSTEVGVHLKFEVPLGLNKRAGKLEAIQAKFAIAQEKLRGLKDQLRISLKSAFAELETALTQVKLASEQVRIAAQLLEAERLKLDEGASDLIVINLRELAYTKAEALEVKAIAHAYKAQARYMSSRGELISTFLRK